MPSELMKILYLRHTMIRYTQACARRKRERWKRKSERTWIRRSHRMRGRLGMSFSRLANTRRLFRSKNSFRGWLGDTILSRPYQAQRSGISAHRYTEAIRRNPDDPAPYSNRAAAYMKLGEFPFALRDCEKCLELDPKYTKAYSRKGSIHFFMKEYHKSLEAYKTALEMDPNNRDLRMDYQRVMATIQQTANSDEVDEEQVKKAMADPEIQKILSDPGVTQVLKEMSEKPEYAQKALEDPVMADKIKKLIAAGVVRVASR
mmetsp:Transcript_28773/g.112201  ORF Transcript_28773/g.112201 Transcript_28773/m.112201 type:complete len:260 (+) Transcript_28773:521-1300(+)